MSIFDARDGSLEDMPALQGLPTFEVSVDGEEVSVELPDDPPTVCQVAMAEHDPDADGRTFIICGAGAAGMVAAETLRQDGFAGNIVMLTQETDPPYDRTDLSKPYLRSDEPSDPTIRGREFYAAHGIDLKEGFVIEEVDAAACRVRSVDGQELQGEKMLLATGGIPRTLDMEGEDLHGVNLLRSFANARTLRKQAEQADRAVVVGASFIGMEVAAGLVKRGCDVTVVAPESVPFERTLGPEIGRMYQRVHEENGVTFRLGQTVQRFVGDDFLEAAILDDDSSVRADLAIVGIGVEPATGYLPEAMLNDDRSVNVDEYLQVAENLYAAGDIATFPDRRTGQSTRIEHWRVAQQQGRLAAHNMLGQDRQYRRVPFFWTNQYMVIVDYIGHATDWDEIVVDGSIDEQDFMAFYLKDRHVRAVSACGRSEAVAAALIALGEEPSPTIEAMQIAISRMIK
jgi:NADPH-dependent 2,4-dienoyl-CoA reductase/sulfur reductase-like enzyme